MWPTYESLLRGKCEVTANETVPLLLVRSGLRRIIPVFLGGRHGAVSATQL